MRIALAREGALAGFFELCFPLAQQAMVDAHVAGDLALVARFFGQAEGLALELFREGSSCCHGSTSMLVSVSKYAFRGVHFNEGRPMTPQEMVAALQANFSKEERQVIFLRLVHGLTEEAIADIMNIPLEVVEALCRKSVEDLPGYFD